MDVSPGSYTFAVHADDGERPSTLLVIFGCGTPD